MNTTVIASLLFCIFCFVCISKQSRHRLVHFTQTNIGIINCVNLPFLLLSTFQINFQKPLKYFYKKIYWILKWLTLESNKKNWSVKFSGPDSVVSANKALLVILIKKFQKSRSRLNDHKGPENINYTIVKYGETFYGRQTALTAAVIKINRF